MTAMIDITDAKKTFTMHLQGGAVVEEGLTDQVLDDPQHAYSQMLVASILPV